MDKCSDLCRSQWVTLCPARVRAKRFSRGREWGMKRVLAYLKVPLDMSQ